MENSETRARLFAAVDEILRDTPVEVVLDAVRSSAGRTQASSAVDAEAPRASALEDAYFRLIFDGSAMGIALVDADGRPIRCNRALERILGCESEELSRLGFPKFTHPEDVALDAGLYQELLAGTRDHYRIEKRYLRKDGRTVSARLTVSLVPSGTKQSIAFLEDVTAERDARERHAALLRALEGRVAELTAIHDLSVVLEDPARPIGEALEGVARALYAAASEPSKSGVRVTFGDALVEAGVLVDAVCTTSQGFGEAGGRQGRIELYHAGPPPPAAPPTGSAGERQLLETVAGRLNAAIDRHRADERLSLAVTAGKVAVWELDFHTGAIQWPGQAATGLRVWPWGSAGTYGGFLDIVHPDDRPIVERELRASRDDPSRKGRYQAEYRIVPTHGEPQVILASGQTIYDDHGKPERMFGVAMDVTERRALERNLLQAQKMEAIGQLAGGVAHDFNNILCVILGYGQLVADALTPQHQVTPQVAQILKAGQAAEALTRQLLAFSRQQVLAPQVLDLNQIVRGVEGMLRRLIREDVALVVELVGEPVVVRVDPGQMEQVLMNLVVNARDAMPKGGRLTIRTTLERDGGSAAGEPPHGKLPPGPRVVLSVTDTGIGMDAATQARVFEPFFTTKAAGVGTGLGLSIVHRIVDQSTGSVDFTSAPGEGTTFRIRLPIVASAPEQQTRTSPDLDAYRGDETILVAEDQGPVRQLVRLWLERRGYHVLEVADGREGIELAKAHGGAIHLLVTDMVMPRAGGRELASAMWAVNPTLPVIFMSGYTTDRELLAGTADPRVCRLEKPLSEAKLLRAVREGLDDARRAAGRAD